MGVGEAEGSGVDVGVGEAEGSGVDVAVGVSVGGASVSKVVPVPLGDQRPVPSPLMARTRTWYSVPGFSPVMVVVVAVPSWVWLVQLFTLASLYCTV